MSSSENNFWDNSEQLTCERLSASNPKESKITKYSYRCIFNSINEEEIKTRHDTLNKKLQYLFKTKKEKN